MPRKGKLPLSQGNLKIFQWILEYFQTCFACAYRQAIVLAVFFSGNVSVWSNPACFSKSLINHGSHYEAFAHFPNVLGLFAALSLHGKYFILYHGQLIIYLYPKLPNHYHEPVKAGAAYSLRPRALKQSE